MFGSLSLAFSRLFFDKYFGIKHKEKRCYPAYILVSVSQFFHTSLNRLDPSELARRLSLVERRNSSPVVT